VAEIDHRLVYAPAAIGLQDTPLPEDRLVYLREEILDKQIVDTFGAKVVRVNDLQFLQLDSQLRLVHVDVGFKGLMRRVGWEKCICAAIHWLFSYDIPDRFIGWKYVQVITGGEPLHLSVSQKKLSELHPAELADILEDLSGHDRSAIFHALDTETAADALEEIDDPKLQKALIETVSVEKASDIIEEMSPNEAADLLADLPQDRADEILQEMNEETAEDLRELLVHEEETAGGIMTTSLLSLPPELTVASAMARLQQEAADLDILYYVYLLDPGGGLSGVVSMRDLLTALPQQRLSEIQTTRLITVNLQAKQDDVVDLLIKYGFRAIPVVDDQNHLKGAVRLRAALEILAPSHV
jgi:Mg/Co/Ni transporter MgtE